jgi:hypothetical protein
MAPEAFDPFAGDEVAPAQAEIPIPAAPPAPVAVDPFAAQNAAPAPSSAPTQPETPVIKQYTVVHHEAHGFGLVLAAGELPGVDHNRNAVVVGWFAGVSDPITTDQLESVKGS